MGPDLCRQKYASIRPRIKINLFGLSLTAAASLGIAGFSFVPSSAIAALTFTRIDGASNYTLVTEGSTSVKVYGGIAGECDGAVTATATCNSCVSNESTAASVRLTACNNTRIHPDLQLTFTFSSDTVATGTPMVRNSDDTDEVQTVGTPADVAKGQTATVTVLWSDVCAAIGGDTLCDTQTALTGSIKVGIEGGNNETLGDATDDAKTIDITVQKAIGQTSFTDENGDVHPPDTVGVSLHELCAADTQVGVCYFSVNPGDEKVTIKALDSDTLPSLENLNAKAVRFYYSDIGFDDISPESTYLDLPLDPSSTEGNASLSSDRIVGLTNETLYYFKSAVVDLANNVGYFTPDELDQICLNEAGEVMAGTTDCHIARPGKVAGILSEDANCFIATAAYGSPMARQVETFRQFRNAYLLPHSWGRSFIRAYYRFGPKVAAVVAGQEWMRASARIALTPALLYATLSLKLGVGTTTILFGLFASAPLLLIFAWTSRRKLVRARISNSIQPR